MSADELSLMKQVIFNYVMLAQTTNFLQYKENCYGIFNWRIGCVVVGFFY